MNYESHQVVRPLLRRRAAATYLRDKWGVPMACKTLTKLAATGGGPPFRMMGRFPLYEIPALDSWVMAKLSKPASSTSELAASMRSASGNK